MKTEAPCPTCNSPFSFWRLVFGAGPLHLYCWKCGWRIVIDGYQKFIWLDAAGVSIISFAVISFVTPGNFSRLFVLAVIWFVLVFILQIIICLMIVNMARFSKPEETAGDTDATQVKIEPSP